MASTVTSLYSDLLAVKQSMLDQTNTGTAFAAVTANVGTAGTGVTAQESGNSVFHHTLLTLNDVSVAVSDTNVGGGTKIYDFPIGRILILGSQASLTPTTTSTIATTLNASKTLSIGVGTVQTTTQASGTLATTEQDICAAGTCTSSATINEAGTGGNTGLHAPVGFDGTGTAKDAYLNVGVPTATDIDGDATVTFDGYVSITWVFLGLAATYQAAV